MKRPRRRNQSVVIALYSNAILLAAERGAEGINIFNLGTDEYCQVNDSIGWISGHLGLTPELTIQQGIIRTLEYLRANAWVLEARG